MALSVTSRSVSCPCYRPLGTTGPLPVPWERWGNKLFASLRLSPPIVVQFYRHRRQDVTGLSPLLPAGLKKWRNDEELTCGRGRSQGRSHTCFSSAVNSLSRCVQWCCMMLHTNLQKMQLPPPITSTAADSQARLMLAVNCQLYCCYAAEMLVSNQDDQCLFKPEGCVDFHVLLCPWNLKKTKHYLPCVCVCECALVC